MVKIIRDPGHGGKDSGAVNDQTGLKEKDVVLKISNGLGRVFATMCEGVQHNCTRSTDVFITLEGRCDIANQYGANFFASFHVDCADAVGQRFTTYIHPNAPQRTRDLSQRLHDEMWNDFYSKFGVFTNGGVRTADYAVLRGTNMDACLFENGFINNMEHVKLLSRFENGGFLDQLTMAYARAFAKVFGFTLNDTQTQQGWVQENNLWYFYDNGRKKTGWQQDGENWFYLNTDGSMITGWYFIEGEWYYFNEVSDGAKGKMLTGWQQVNSSWFYLNPNSDGTKGRMLTGWQKINDKWYYFNPISDGTRGAMVTGKLVIDGKEYTFNVDGALIE